MNFKEDLQNMMQKFPEGDFKIFKVRHYNEKGNKHTIIEIGGFFVINQNNHVNNREANKIFSKIKHLLKNYKAV